MQSLLFVWIIEALMMFGLVGNTNPSTAPLKKQVKILCKMTGCKTPVNLYQFDGVNFNKIQEGKLVGQDSVLLVLEKGDPQFYYIGLDDGKQKRPILLGGEENVLLEGNCRSMRGAKTPGSKANDDYEKVIADVRKMKSNMQNLMKGYQRVYKDEQKRKPVEAKMGVIDQQKIKYLDSLKKANPLLSKIAASYTYLSFQNHPNGHPNEVAHFANEYFRYVDLKDPDYNKTPAIFEGFREYAQTLGRIRIKEEILIHHLDNILKQIPAQSKTKMYALGGFMAGLRQAKNPLFGKYAEVYVKEFEKINPTSAEQVKVQIKQAQSLIVGAEAPDFTQKTPEGKDMSLKDLRGKVVLLDFWASWCGPCRKENPNVVKMYKKYQDKGFDILAVSLDKTKDRWLKAIKQDGLTWHHVSDLRGWSNSAARTYNVTSIPQTVLLDKDGKIIARNLRGASLERKLEELLGNK